MTIDNLTLNKVLAVTPGLWIITNVVKATMVAQ